MAHKFDYIVGQRFGRLVAQQIINEDWKEKTNVLCLCDCGNTKIANLVRLERGYVRSCGCLRIEKSTATLHKYQKENSSAKGDGKSRLYHIWYSMLSRCYNKNCKEYVLYGARGIVVCDEWKNDYIVFKKWSMEHGYKDYLTIDRINNNGNYEPLNCSWATMKEQCRNRRNNHILIYKNEKKTIAEWSELTNISYSNIIARLNRGWSVEKTLEIPVRNNNKN